ncbi:MAG: hypothetical protein V3U87_03105 [Methylococcaceae bacterium]
MKNKQLVHLACLFVHLRSYNIGKAGVFESAVESVSWARNREKLLFLSLMMIKKFA